MTTDVIIVKEFKRCTKCKGTKWFVQEMRDESAKYGAVPEDFKAALTVRSVQLISDKSPHKVGDNFITAIAISDVCMGCGHEQVVRLEKAKGQVVMRMPGIESKIAVPGNGSGLNLLRR